MFIRSISFASPMLRNSRAGLKYQYKQSCQSYSVLTYKHSYQGQEDIFFRPLKPISNFNIVPKRNSSVSSYFSTEYFPIRCGVQLLESVHDLTGLPWWATILVSTFTLKLCIVFPVFLISVKVQHRLQSLKPELKARSHEIKREIKRLQRRNDWSESKARFMFKTEIKQMRNELYKRDNCHPIRISLPLFVQLPLWLSMSIAMRNLAGMVPFHAIGAPLRPELAAEGTLWFQNLLIPDPYFILPVCVGILNLAISEINVLQTREKEWWFTVSRYTANTFIALIVLIGTYMPSGVVLFWTCSSAFGLIQHSLLLSPKVRSSLGLRHTGSQTPYKDLLESAKIRYSVKRKFTKKT